MTIFAYMYSTFEKEITEGKVQHYIVNHVLYSKKVKIFEKGHDVIDVKEETITKLPDGFSYDTPEEISRIPVAYWKRTLIEREFINNKYAYYQHHHFVATNDIAPFNYRKKVKFQKLNKCPNELESCAYAVEVIKRGARHYYDSNNQLIT